MNPDSGYLLFDVLYNNDREVYPTEVRWGNYDLDWVLLSTCRYLNYFGSSTQLSRLKYMMAGAHEILGYETRMSEYRDSGRWLGQTLIGLFQTEARTFRYAWNNTAEAFQATGKVARTMYGPGNANEYLPGYGAHGAEPSPYPTSAVYLVDYTTS